MGIKFQQEFGKGQSTTQPQQTSQGEERNSTEWKNSIESAQSDWYLTEVMLSLIKKISNCQQELQIY
jgi:hypothetical protein